MQWLFKIGSRSNNYPKSVAKADRSRPAKLSTPPNRSSKNNDYSEHPVVNQKYSAILEQTLRQGIGIKNVPVHKDHVGDDISENTVEQLISQESDFFINEELFRCIKKDDSKRLRNLISSYKTSSNTKNDTGFGLLHSAIESNAKKCFKTLLEFGLDVNAPGGKSGETAMHIAAREEDPEFIEALIRQNADLNTSDLNGYTPLHSAILAGKEKNALFLIQREEALLDTHGGEHGDTPLFSAVLLANYSVVRALIKKGASIMTPNNQNDRPFHRALRNASNKPGRDCLKIVYQLLKAGPDLGRTRDHGDDTAIQILRNPLMFGPSASDTQLVKIIWDMKETIQGKDLRAVKQQLLHKILQELS